MSRVLLIFRYYFNYFINLISTKMALQTTTSGFPPISSAVAFDFNSQYVGDPNDYNTAMNLQQAINRPFGLEFDIMSKNNRNEYSANRVPQVSASSLDRVMYGYNTFSPVPTTSQVGGYSYAGGYYGIDKYLW